MKKEIEQHKSTYREETTRDFIDVYFHQEKTATAGSTTNPSSDEGSR